MIENLMSFLAHLRRSRYYISQDASGNCIQGGGIIQSDNITHHDLQIRNDRRCCHRHNVLDSVISYIAIIPGPSAASVPAPVPRLAQNTYLGNTIIHSPMKCTHRTFWGAQADRVLTAKID